MHACYDVHAVQKVIDAMFKFASILVLAGSAVAQTPNAPHPKFFDKVAPSTESKCELAIDTALIGVDGFTTRRIIADGGYERDFLARPFAHSSAGMALGTSLGVSGLGFGNYMLRKHPWRRRLLNLSVMAVEGYNVGSNISQLKGHHRL